MSTPKRVLTVALDPDLLQRVGSVFGRSSVAIDACEQGAEGLQKIARERFDLVICSYPLPDLRLRDFVMGLRASSAASRQASLLLLTPPELTATSPSGIERGPCLVLPSHEEGSEIADGAARLLQVAPRHAPRVKVSLRVSVGESEECFGGWVVNLSTSGMLVTDSPMLPLGRRCVFEFALPSGESVRGSGVVVRHAAPRREKVTGFALRFLEFEGEGSEVLERWCASGCG